MLQVTTKNVRDRIEAVRTLAIFNDCIRSHVLDETNLSWIAGWLGANQYCQARKHIAPGMQWRVFSHCASVTRLYALYESFVYQLISDWITKVPEFYSSYSALPPNVTIAHRIGVGQLLQKLGGPRTEHLTELKLIDGLFRGLSSTNPYTLLSDAFFVDLANLRLDELDRLFGRVGLSGLSGWLITHTQMKQFCEGAGVAVGDQLKDLIDYRNAAAHRGDDISDLLGVSALSDLVDFILILCEAIHEFVLCRFCEDAEKIGKFLLVGKVTEFFKIPKASIVAGISLKLSIGDQLIVKGSRTCFLTDVVSLQRDGANVDSLDANSLEIGITLSRPAHIGMSLYKIV